MPKSKRSSEDPDDLIIKRQKKITKLEKKLKRYKESLPVVDPEALSILEEENNMMEEDKQEENYINRAEIIDQEEEDVEINDEELPQDILEALGESNNDEDANYGAEVNSEIVKIINPILTDGLSKEIQEALAKTKIPRNIKLLDAPKLNTEFAGLLNNSMTNRDKLLKDRQQDLGRAIALVVQTINNLTKKDFDKLLAIKTLTDSTRLLSSLHYNYTDIRRKLIAPSMDKSLTQNLHENKRSEFLYSKLEESVKTSSAMKRTINILKPKNTPKNYQNSRRTTAPNQFQPRPNNVNYKPRPYQNNQASTYKPQRSHQRPPQQAKSTRRPATFNHRGRARYP